MKKITLSILLCSIMNVVVAQNTCTTAQIITAGTHTITVINGSQGTTTICTGGPNGANAEWYSYTPTSDYSVTVTSDSSEIPGNTGRDTRFQVYDGTCAALTCISGDDDSGAGFTSAATFNVTNGTTYFIAWDNRWESDGFQFELREEPIVVNPFNFITTPITTQGSYKNCVVDMTGDNLDDIVTVNSNTVYIYEQQVGGGFLERTRTISPATSYDPSWSIAAGDFDFDGYNDLMFGGGSGVSFVQSNAGGTSYTGIQGPTYVFSQRTNFVDLDADGHLDAFVCHDVGPNQFYVNNGSNILMQDQGGIGDAPTGGNYATLWFDYDNDGDTDVFISKCNGGGASASARYNELHRRNADESFTDVSVASGLYDPIQTWSSAIGDYDNDGYMDIFVGASNFTDGAHKMMQNNGDGTFSNVTVGTGFGTFTGTSIEHITHDFNNDGYLDVFTASNRIFHNNGDMTFTEYNVGFSVGAIGDLNNDGFLDVYNSNGNWYRNTGNTNSWIKINTIGIGNAAGGSNINGIGARVEIVSALGTQIRDVRSGDGFRHMSSLMTHFGLGADSTITQITVNWPSGIVDVVTNPAINQQLDIVEGSTLTIDDYTLDALTLFPNPAVDYVEFGNYNLTDAKVSIHDITGKRIFNFSVNDRTIDVSKLTTGPYILLLQKGSKLAKYKFIKK